MGSFQRIGIAWAAGCVVATALALVAVTTPYGGQGVDDAPETSPLHPASHRDGGPERALPAGEVPGAWVYEPSLVTRALGMTRNIEEGFVDDPAHATAYLRWVAGERHAQIVEDSAQIVAPAADGTTVTVTTSGLKPGYAYTLWVGFFNAPEHCAAPPPMGPERCGYPDAMNPLTDMSMVYGDGAVTTDGTATFEAYIPRGVAPAGEERIAHGSGILTNPTGAEYLTVVRSHGPADPRYMPAQVETLNGGCHAGEDSHPCRDVQGSGFRWTIPLECVEAPECAFTEDESPLAG